jgi:hypothetical protein
VAAFQNPRRQRVALEPRDKSQTFAGVRVHVSTGHNLVSEVLGGRGEFVRCESHEYRDSGGGGDELTPPFHHAHPIPPTRDCGPYSHVHVHVPLRKFAICPSVQGPLSVVPVPNPNSQHTHQCTPNAVHPAPLHMRWCCCFLLLRHRLPPSAFRVRQAHRQLLAFRRFVRYCAAPLVSPSPSSSLLLP